MKTLYQDQNGKVYVDDGNLEEMAIALGLKPVKEMEELKDLITTEVIKDGKWLTPKEIEDYYNKYKNVCDEICEGDDISKEAKSSLIADMKKFIFILTLEYRGGEKIKIVSARIDEDPVEKYKNWEDWSDYYEIMFDNQTSYDLWCVMKDIYREVAN